MLALVMALPVAVAVVAGAVDFQVFGRARPGDNRASGERQISLLAESLAYVGALLALAGAGIVAQQRWLHIANTERVTILTGAALVLLLGGFAVRWSVHSRTHRLTENLWLASIASAAAATATESAGVCHHSAGVTVLAVSWQLTVYSAIMWFLCRRELLAVVVFSGLIATLCSGITVIAGHGAPWLAVGLGVWLLGIAWAVLGVVYPQPLGTSLTAGASVALLGPAIAVHHDPWVYAVGIVTAAAVMAASLPLKNIVLLAFGSIALFCYLTGAVFRFADRTLGVAETLLVVGGLLIVLAVLTVWLSRLTRTGSGHGGAPAS